MAKKQRRGNGQGTVYKRTDRGCWIAAWYDANGRRVEASTRTTDKGAAERILRKHVTDAALRREGVVDTRLEAVCKQAQRPIGEHLNEWRSALEAKGTSEKRIKMAFGRARRMVADCRFSTLADVGPARVHGFIQGKRDADAAARTINGYLQALKQFTRWAVAEGRLTTNPLASIGMVKVIGQTRNRRPLGIEELARLIDAAEHGSTHKRLSGRIEQRALGKLRRPYIKQTITGLL